MTFVTGPWPDNKWVNKVQHNTAVQMIKHIMALISTEVNLQAYDELYNGRK
jgi:hypothetical protein